MSTKCASCNAQIPIVFLEKIEGTYLRDKKSKKRPICASCQRQYTTQELKSKL